MTSQGIQSEKQWRRLLREIRVRSVVPIVGPRLVESLDSSGETKSLNSIISPRLAAALELDEPDTYRNYNHVARSYLRRGGDRKNLCIELGDLLENFEGEPSDTLRKLARIKDFELFLCSTPDDLVSRAVGLERPEFSQTNQTFQFHSTGISSSSGMLANGNVKSACDIPDNLNGTAVYQFLGDFTLPDFAVWEEDYMEFVCGLIENRDTLPNFFRYISQRNILLLGAPAEVWVVRFFLRAARGQRLSESNQSVFLADEHSALGEPMVFFFDHALRSTQIINGDPALFIDELFSRWSSSYESNADFLASIPDEMPRKSVFVSYSHADSDLAIEISANLARAGIPVWLDKKRLQIGQDFDRQLEYAVKHDASFFVSLISESTESNEAKYVHNERRWAASKHVEGYVFYIPYEIGQLPVDQDTLEPDCFSSKHREVYTPESLPEFVRQVREYWDQFSLNGHPRD